MHMPRRRILLSCTCWMALTAQLASCKDVPRGGAPSLVVERDSVADTLVVRNVSGSGWDVAPRLVEEMHIDGTGGSADVPVGRVTSLAVDGDDRVYAYDAMSRALLQYDARGRFRRKFGRSGGGPGEFRTILGLAVLSDGRIAARDAARVLVFTKAGDYEAAWQTRGGVMLPGADVLVADTAGGVYTTAPAGSRMRDGVLEIMQQYTHLSRSGSVIDTITRPTWPELPPPLTAFAVRGLVALSPRGQLVSARSDRYEVNVDEPDGRVLRFGRADQSPVELEAAERSAYQRFYDELSRRDPLASHIEVPKEKPLLRAVRVGDAGRFWVGVHAPAVQSIGSGDALQRPLEAPDAWREPEIWDVFQHSGEYLGRIQLPLGATALAMRKDRIWGLVRDDDGVPSIVRWRVETH